MNIESNSFYILLLCVIMRYNHSSCSLIVLSKYAAINFRLDQGQCQSCLCWRGHVKVDCAKQSLHQIWLDIVAISRNL